MTSLGEPLKREEVRNLNTYIVSNNSKPQLIFLQIWDSLKQIKQTKVHQTVPTLIVQKSVYLLCDRKVHLNVLLCSNVLFYEQCIMYNMMYFWVLSNELQHV